MQNSRNALIIVLVFIAVALGFLIYRKQMPSISRQPSPTSPTTGQMPSESVSDETAKRELSAEEQAALTPPSRDASSAEQQDFLTLISRLAKESKFLDISGCFANPLVFRVKFKSSFTARNSDKVDRVIVFDEKNQFIVPAQETKEIKADFGKGPGIYGMGCDSSTGARGMFLITE